MVYVATTTYIPRNYELKLIPPEVLCEAPCLKLHSPYVLFRNMMELAEINIYWRRYLIP